MATPQKNSDGLLYPLVLAYALVLFSLWKLDAGISGSSSLISSGNTNLDDTSLAPSQRFATSRRSRESTLEQTVIDSSNGRGAETKQDELRRLAALALIKHVAEDGIRRGRPVEARSPNGALATR